MSGTSRLESFSNKIMPVAEKVSTVKFLKALAETMQAILPVTIIGSFACLFAFIDIGPWQNFLAAHPILPNTFLNIQGLTLNSMSLYVIIILPYLYARQFNLKEGVSCVVLNLAAFLLLTPNEPMMNIPMQWLGSSGLFSAMLISFVVVRIVKFCVDKHITIHMPAGVPEFVENSFVVIIAAAIIVFGFGFLGQFLLSTSFGSVHQMLYSFIQTPLAGFGSSLPSLIFGAIIGSLTMFCGIHGSTVLAYLDPIKAANDVENLAAATAGEALPHIFTSGMWTSVLCGGIGATLGLAIVMVIFCRSARYKQLSRMALIPQIFNIGEPLLFGIPIMLNPLLLIPYVGGMVVNVIVVYGAIAIGLCAPFTGVTVAFTVPTILSGALSCSVPWQGALLQAVVLIIDCLIWYPFVKMIDKQALKEEKEAQADETVQLA